MKNLAIGFTLVLALIAPLVFYPTFLMQVMCFALFASAFNLLFGYTGLISFGHAAFFGFAAYISGYTAKEFGFTPEVAILFGGMSAAMLGLVIGSLAIRQQGIIFAMITMSLAEVVYFVCLRAPFTGGEDGLQSVPRGHLFGLIDLSNSFSMYYFVLALFIACSLLIYRIIHSPFGQVLKAIRENESRAISMGYRTDRYKLVAFILSATLAGIAGATKTIVFQLATLSDVHWHKSGEVVLMTLLGGLGTLVGPWVGAGFVVALQDGLAELGEWVPFILGLTFVVCVLLFRRGIIGELLSFLSSRAETTPQCEPPVVKPLMPMTSCPSSETLPSTR